jgi:hypothetical protein
MSQCDIILKAMLENKHKKIWKATDFLSGKYFVGYEATARMSDLLRMYPDLVIAGKDGRFRTLSINWKCKNIKEFEKRLNVKRLIFG